MENWLMMRLSGVGAQSSCIIRNSINKFVFSSWGINVSRDGPCPQGTPSLVGKVVMQMDQQINITTFVQGGGST